MQSICCERAKKNGSAPVQIRIQSLTDYNEETCFQMLMKSIKEEPKKAVKNVWKSFAPERWLLFLLERADIDPSLNRA